MKVKSIIPWMHTYCRFYTPAMPFSARLPKKFRS